MQFRFESNKKSRINSYKNFFRLNVKLTVSFNRIIDSFFDGYRKITGCVQINFNEFIYLLMTKMLLSNRKNHLTWLRCVFCMKKVLSW